LLCFFCIFFTKEKLYLCGNYYTSQEEGWEQLQEAKTVIDASETLADGEAPLFKKVMALLQFVKGKVGGWAGAYTTAEEVYDKVLVPAGESINREGMNSIYRGDAQLLEEYHDGIEFPKFLWTKLLDFLGVNNQNEYNYNNQNNY
jgi:hypothetical protein